MKLLKTFLFALLLLPATSWAMEDDAQLLSDPSFETDSAYELVTHLKKAKPIFQVILQAVAKKVNLPAHSYLPVALEAELPKPLDAATASSYPICLIITSSAHTNSFALKKVATLHEAWHIFDIKRLRKRDILAECETTQCQRAERQMTKDMETFADTHAISGLGCYACAQEIADQQKDPFNVLKSQGLLDAKQILALAKKSYSKTARCPYHKALECAGTRLCPPTIAWSAQEKEQITKKMAAYFESCVEHGLLDVF